MPVTYAIDAASGIIHTRCVGDVSLGEVVGHFDTLIQDPDCPDRLDVLLDFSPLTSIPASSELRLVTRKIEDVSSRVSFRHCAIVAPTDVLYGMTRIFATFAQKQFSSVRVFRDAGEAWTWLESAIEP